jgi:hypothetical protein
VPAECNYNNTAFQLLLDDCSNESQLWTCADCLQVPLALSICTTTKTPIYLCIHASIMSERHVAGHLWLYLSPQCCPSTRDGCLRSPKPTSGCLTAIATTGIARPVFSTRRTYKLASHAPPNTTETTRIHSVIFAMQNRTFGPYLAVADVHAAASQAASPRIETL